MELAEIIADAQIAISVAKLAIQVGQDAAPYIENAYQVLFNNTPLTAQQRADMAAQETAWRNDIDKVIDADSASA